MLLFDFVLCEEIGRLLSPLRKASAIKSKCETLMRSDLGTFPALYRGLNQENQDIPFCFPLEGSHTTGARVYVCLCVCVCVHGVASPFVTRIPSSWTLSCSMVHALHGLPLVPTAVLEIWVKKVHEIIRISYRRFLESHLFLLIGLYFHRNCTILSGWFM